MVSEWDHRPSRGVLGRGGAFARGPVPPSENVWPERSVFLAWGPWKESDVLGERRTARFLAVSMRRVLCRQPDGHPRMKTSSGGESLSMSPRPSPRNQVK